MKNLYSLLSAAFLLISLSANATIYLVQKGGNTDPVWSANTISTTGGTVVDLTVAAKSLPAWYNATTLASGDKIWVISGTYIFDAFINTKSGISIYGGFAGNETSVNERIIPANAKPWEFSNETVFDGNNTVALISAGGARSGVIFDGFTVTKGIVNAVKLRGTEVIQNCIIKNNTASSGGNGAAMLLYQGGSVKNCYFYNNNAATSTGNGGAIYVLNLSNANQIIENCIFENNNAEKGSAIYTNSVNAITVKNCLINSSTGNENPTDIYIANNFNLYNCTIINATTPAVYINGLYAVKLYNNVLWGNSTNLSGGGSSTVEVKNCAFMNPARSEWTQSGNITLDVANTGTDSEKFYPNFKADYSLNFGSALINTGLNIGTDLDKDFWGTLRPNGAAYDIGYHEFDNLSTGINSKNGVETLIYAVNGKIHFKNQVNTTNISVYNINGSLIKSFELDKYREISLTKGIYLIKSSTIDHNYSKLVIVN